MRMALAAVRRAVDATSTRSSASSPGPGGRPTPSWSRPRRSRSSRTPAARAAWRRPSAPAAGTTCSSPPRATGPSASAPPRTTAGENRRPAIAEVSTLLVEPRWGRRGHGGRLLAAAAAALRGARRRGAGWRGCPRRTRRRAVLRARRLGAGRRGARAGHRRRHAAGGPGVRRARPAVALGGVTGAVRHRYSGVQRTSAGRPAPNYPVRSAPGRVAAAQAECAVER